MTDQEPIAAAILTALNTALSGVAVAYDIDGIPAAASRYVAVRLYRHPGDGRRYGGSQMLPGYFLDTTYRAPSVQNCRELRRLVNLALEDQAIGAYGPFVFNDESQPIDDDPDWKYSGVDTWQFC